MGNSINKNDDTQVINPDSNDELLYSFKGVLHKKNLKIGLVSVKFYEDYLTFNSDVYFEEINYYDIPFWESKQYYWKFKYLDRFTNKTNVYTVFINDVVGKVVSDKLLNIIKEHVKFKDNI